MVFRVHSYSVVLLFFEHTHSQWQHFRNLFPSDFHHSHSCCCLYIFFTISIGMRTECARSPILMVFSKTKLSKLGQLGSKGWGKDEGEAEELVCFLFLNNSISKWICFISVQVDGIADFCAVTGRMWTGPRHQKSNGTAFMVLRCCVHSVSAPLSPFGSFRLFYCYHYKVLIRRMNAAADATVYDVWAMSYVPIGMLCVYGWFISWNIFVSAGCSLRSIQKVWRN